MTVSKVTGVLPTRTTPSALVSRGAGSATTTNVMATSTFAVLIVLEGRSNLTKNFLMVQAPGFIRGINPKSQIENPQAPAFIRGVNLKSKI